MPNTKSKWLAKKIEFVLLALDATTIPGLVDKLLPADKWLDSEREKMVSNLYHWKRGHETSSTTLMERVKYELNINEGVGVIQLMECTVSEFFGFLPADYREQITKTAGPDLQRILSLKDALRSKEESALPAADVHRSLMAGTRLLTEIQEVCGLKTRNGTNSAKLWNEASWALSSALHNFIDSVADEPEFVLAVVGPAENQGCDAGRPAFLAVTGRTSEPLDGDHATTLNGFLDERSGMFPDRPPKRPPTTDRPRATKGLLLQLWEPAESFPEELLGKLESEGAVCKSYCFSIDAIQARRNMYLELSKKTELVYLFRVIGPGTVRIVVTVDLLEDRQLRDYECCFILEAARQVLSVLCAGGSTAQ